MKVVAQNRKASFNYHLLERFEAGLVLKGSEVKSLREGRANLGDAYAVIKGGEAFLLNCHISRYPPAAGQNHDPLRTRKLLFHQREVEKLAGKLKERGLTLIPIQIYFNKEGRAKIELALAKGKKLFDKRETLKKRESRRAISRAMKYKSGAK